MRPGSAQASDQIQRLVRGHPASAVVFLPPDASIARLAESLAALANAHGGIVLLGVSASGKVTGVSDEPAVRAAIREAGLTTVPPLILPPPACVDVDGRSVCAISVPPGLPHAYSVDGRYFTRTGARNRLLNAAELTALLVSRDEAGYAGRPAPAASLDDLDPDHVAAYLAVLPSAINQAWQQILLAQGCVAQQGHELAPTYTGILLFGKAPQRFLRNAQITLVRYAGPQMGDEFVREDATGTLAQQIRRAEAFVAANMRRGMRIGGLTRSEVTEYPMAVVREAVVNAVAHRDYSIHGDGIRVLMFSNRMEIYSPGRLPGHVTLENLLTERFSRNEAIMQALSDLGFVERLGYGVDRMIAAMEDAGLPAPAFEETVAGFRVVLHGRGDDLVSAESTSRWSNRRLDPRQEQALAYLVQHGSITNRQFRDLVPDISDETVRRLLADLVDQGLVIKIGERKATYYILKETGTSAGAS